MCEEKNEKNEKNELLCEDSRFKDSKQWAFVTSVISFFVKGSEKSDNANKGKTIAFCQIRCVPKVRGHSF